MAVRQNSSLDRRQLLSGSGVLAVSALLGPSVARSQTLRLEPSDLFKATRAALANGRNIQSGRVVLDIPRLAESGNSVQLKLRVESPMTAGDHVRTVHLLSEQNPIATIGRFHFTPRSGRAEAETYIRLATTQNVHAIAEMSDGTLWGTEAEAVVLLAACLDGG